MEENFNNNQQPKMQEPKKKEPSLKTKRNKAKAAVITLSTIGALMLGLQVYASTNGYGNVFFMIKNLITTGNPAGNQEIFLDKDITLSYKSIDLAEGLKIQANRLEIKDGKTKLFLSVKSQNEGLLPLKYEVTTNKNETTATKITGNMPQNTDYFDYEDILTLDYEVEGNDTIVLKIKDSNDKELRTLEINLQTREITVKGEKDFEKISEIELKKYLSVFSNLNNGIAQSDNLISIAETLIEVGGEYEGYGIIANDVLNEALRNNSRRELINQIIKEIYGDEAKFEMKKNSQGQEVEVLKGISVYELEDVWANKMGSLDNKNADSYTATADMSEYRYGKCLKIEDIKFENDIYTVKYIYVLATSEEFAADKIEELPQYETIIKLKRNENNKYSKYEIVSLEKGTEIKNKVNLENVEKDDMANIKLSSAGVWYSIDLYNNNEMKIRFTSDDFDKVIGSINVDKTKGYSITGINGKVKKIYQSNNGTSVDPMTFFLLEDGTIQYILPFEQLINGMPTSFKIDGKIDQVKDAVDIKTNGNDVVIAVLKNGQEVKIWNQFMENWGNDETTETTSNTTSSNTNVDNYVHYFNWVKYRAPGLKFEYPTELKLEDTGKQNDGELSTIITGALVGRDVDTNQPIYSNIKIKVFNPMIVDEKVMNNLKYNPENGLERANMTTNKGLKWYESKGQSDEAGYNETETYSNFYQTADGKWGMRQIEFMTDNRNNFKITNLINYIIGSTESASY